LSRDRPGGEPLDLFGSLDEAFEPAGEEPEPSGEYLEPSGKQLESTGKELESDGPPAAVPSAEEAEPTDPGPRIWSVSELNARARAVLQGAFDPVWVSGEIANWTRARSGHCYFTLKDESAQVRCVLWKRDAARLPADPEEGMQVRAFGEVGLYEARGEFQLSVRTLEAEGGEGLWKIAFEKLRRALELEGLLDPARKRPIPPFPRVVGVVTSPTGAAIRDILRVIARRAPWTRVVVRGARVQGEGSSAEVARALDALGRSGLCDVIIVGRGGGSIEDLWAFNEEPVARAIAQCPVPVISAVGHETDTTISDLVADLRAPTPSAAAEAAVPDRESVEALLRKVEPRLSRGLRSVVERRKARVREVNLRLLRSLERRLEPSRRALDRGWDRLAWAARKAIGVRRERLGRLAAGLEAMSPLETLARGYAVPVSPEGRTLRRVQDFSPGEQFSLRVLDGLVVSRVDSIEPLEVEDDG
jgi:exodeoxyribonuclease VII large subunit